MILVTEYWYLSNINTLLGRRAKHFKSLENPKRMEIPEDDNTTLYNNRSILICQNSDYISKK